LVFDPHFPHSIFLSQHSQVVSPLPSSASVALLDPSRPSPKVASVLVRQIAALVSKSDKHITAKLEKLGVYDLQALQLASSILQNEAG
jgi:hypothetical protein